MLQRCWAAVRGSTNFEHLAATDRWATWQRLDEEEHPDGLSTDLGEATDRRD